jgi:heme-degrading monooxygenase HmoA
MYAVIFKAVIAELDPSYYETAKVLRSRAKDLYGCMAFESYQDGEEEVSISYWQDEAQIEAWKRDPVHLQAQQLGRERWYRSYRVEIVKLLKRYEHKM